MDDQRPIRRERLGPLVVECLQLIDIHEVQLVLIVPSTASDVLENGVDRAVEIDILVDARHQRLDALRKLAEHGEFVLTQIALIAPVFGNDQIFEKCAVEEEKLGLR